MSKQRISSKSDALSARLAKQPGIKKFLSSSVNGPMGLDHMECDWSRYKFFKINGFWRQTKVYIYMCILNVHFEIFGFLKFSDHKWKTFVWQILHYKVLKKKNFLTSDLFSKSIVSKNLDIFYGSQITSPKCEFSHRFHLKRCWVYFAKSFDKFHLQSFDKLSEKREKLG